MALFVCGWEAGLAAYYTSLGWTLTGATLGTTYKHVRLDGSGGAYGCTCGSVTRSPTFSTLARWLHCATIPTTSNTSSISIAFYRSGIATFAVSIDNSGVVRLRRGGHTGAAVLTQTSSTSPNTPHWIAINLVAADSGGSCELWVDGVQIATFSGDTKAATTADWDQVDFYGGSISYDDIVVTDGTEGRLVEQFIPAIRPDGDDSVQLTRSEGSTNASCVDEVPVNTTDYNSTTTNNYQDTYTNSDLPWSPPSSGIHCISTGTYNSRDTGLTTAEIICKPGSTAYYSSTRTIPASGYGATEEIRNTDPDTSAAWTESGVNGLKTGIRFTT